MNGVRYLQWLHRGRVSEAVHDLGPGMTRGVLFVVRERITAVDTPLWHPGAIEDHLTELTATPNPGRGAR